MHCYPVNQVSNYISCYVQALPVATASVRNVHSQCPREVLQFILDLIKYNDNRLNKVSCFDFSSH